MQTLGAMVLSFFMTIPYVQTRVLVGKELTPLSPLETFESILACHISWKMFYAECDTPCLLQGM